MRRLFVLLSCASLGVLTTPAAAAHEQRELGPLEITVGWASEPSFVGELNAVSLRVERDGNGVGGLADDLQVDVWMGDASTGNLTMRAVFGDPGHYESDLIPTAPGAYSFHFTGTIEGEELDETFTAGDGTFDEVHGTSEIAFPQAAPSNAELAAAIDALGPRIDEASASSRSAVSTARLLAIIALVLGGGALIFTFARRT